MLSLPATTARLAPVALGKVLGLPSSLKYAMTANANASRSRDS